MTDDGRSRNFDQATGAAGLGPGGLALVVGASGVGKDTLIDAARSRLAGEPLLYFPRRVITRPAHAGGETHIAVSPEQFAQDSAAGRYFLTWQSHGLAYAVPGDVANWIRAGRLVVVNVSRGVIATCEALAANVVVINVTASQETLAARIAARGRETPADIAARLARSMPIGATTAEVVEIRNDGDLAPATAAFIEVLRRLLVRLPSASAR